MPKVSVIIPNYNYARYLPERIDSILNQTFQDFELIILDDCSTDGSREVIERYRNHPLVSAIVYNEANSGNPFHQWEKGIAIAKGEYIWIAEADDVAEPNFLQEMVGALMKNPSAAVCVCGTKLIDQDGKPINDTFNRWERCDDFNRGMAIRFNGLEYLIHNLYWINTIHNASAAIFKKSAYNTEDFALVTTMRNAGDWLFWSIMATKGDVVEYRRKLSMFRRHSSATTIQGQANINLYKEDIRVIAAIESLTPIGRYRKAIRRGELIKKMKRLPIGQAERAELMAEITDILKASNVDYIIERINKPLANLIPGIITSRNDELIN